MRFVKIVLVFSTVLIALLIGNSVYADQPDNQTPQSSLVPESTTTNDALQNSYNEVASRLSEMENHFNGYGQQLSKMQEKLSGLITIIKAIERMGEQLGLQEERVDQVELDVEGYKDRSEKRFTQLETGMSDYQSKAGKLESGISAVKNELESRIAKLTERVRSLGLKGKSLDEELTAIRDMLERNQKMSTANQQQLIDLNGEVGRFDNSFNQRVISVVHEVSSLNQVISSRTLYMIISMIVLVLVASWFIYRSYADNAALSDEITKVREVSDSEYNALDVKLSEILGKQISLEALREQKGMSEEPDHSLPLKVATEIHRMRKRIVSMPDDTKGMRPLAKALERLEDNLVDKNYEIVDLFEQKYVEGMTVNLEFTLDEKLSPGERVITNVIKPQVNHNGKIIQVADVVVSTGE